MTVLKLAVAEKLSQSWQRNTCDKTSLSASIIIENTDIGGAEERSSYPNSEKHCFWGKGKDSS